MAQAHRFPKQCASFPHMAAICLIPGHVANAMTHMKERAPLSGLQREGAARETRRACPDFAE